MSPNHCGCLNFSGSFQIFWWGDIFLSINQEKNIFTNALGCNYSQISNLTDNTYKRFSVKSTLLTIIHFSLRWEIGMHTGIKITFSSCTIKRCPQIPFLGTNFKNSRPAQTKMQSKTVWIHSTFFFLTWILLKLMWYFDHAHILEKP